MFYVLLCDDQLGAATKGTQRYRKPELIILTGTRKTLHTKRGHMGREPREGAQPSRCGAKREPEDPGHVPSLVTRAGAQEEGKHGESFLGAFDCY